MYVLSYKSWEYFFFIQTGDRFGINLKIFWESILWRTTNLPFSELMRITSKSEGLFYLQLRNVGIIGNIPPCSLKEMTPDRCLSSCKKIAYIKAIRSHYRIWLYPAAYNWRNKIIDSVFLLGSRIKKMPSYFSYMSNTKLTAYLMHSLKPVQHLLASERSFFSKNYILFLFFCIIHKLYC